MVIFQCCMLRPFLKASVISHICSLSIRAKLPAKRQMSSNLSDFSGMDLREVVQRLKRFASLSLAASWDNVGLLVEPSSPHVVKHILLTNDLTDGVLQEAVDAKTNMIISYHPPIFQPLKKLTQGSWKERIIVKCIENRIAVYSPHTILDSLKGGVTDWLISPFGGVAEPLKTALSSEVLYSVTVNVPEFTEDLRSAVAKLSFDCPDTLLNGTTSIESNGARLVSLQLTCSEKVLSGVIGVLSTYASAEHAVQAVKLAQTPLIGCGDGRIVRLGSEEGMTLREALQRTKSHLKLSHVRLACPYNITLDSVIHSVAVCAGAGASVLAGVTADVFVTGEMSHHEVLNACHSGTCVILCEHSNTERGYLAVLRERLGEVFDGKVDVGVSSVDRDPLEVV